MKTPTAITSAPWNDGTPFFQGIQNKDMAW